MAVAQRVRRILAAGAIAGMVAGVGAAGTAYWGSFPAATSQAAGASTDAWDYGVRTDGWEYGPGTDGWDFGIGTDAWDY